MFLPIFMASVGVYGDVGLFMEASPTTGAGASSQYFVYKSDSQNAVSI